MLTKTVSNGIGFLEDVAKAFNHVQGQELQITAILRGTNVIEYIIEKKTVK